MSEKSDRRIAQWALNGPNSSDGTLGWVLGNLLWWRFWATTGLHVTPLVVGLVALASHGEYWGVLATVAAHAVLYERMMRVNPKYNVTKNY